MLGSVAATAPAQAKAPGANGQIVFGRYSTALGDFQIFTANPDGTHQAQVLPGAAECPRWSPGGARIGVCVTDPGGLVRPATVRPNGSGFTLLENPDRTLNLGCWAWSPNGARLACEGWDDSNPSQPAGVFTVRSADGGGLVRVTANPNGNHDIPGDYSPGGGRISFLRVTDSDSETGTLYAVNTDGSGLRRITAPGFAEDSGSWSPDGKWILFSNNKQKLFVVHPDGTGLHQINLDISGSYFASERTVARRHQDRAPPVPGQHRRTAPLHRAAYRLRPAPAGRHPRQRRIPRLGIPPAGEHKGLDAMHTSSSHSSALRRWPAPALTRHPGWSISPDRSSERAS